LHPGCDVCGIGEICATQLDGNLSLVGDLERSIHLTRGALSEVTGQRVTALRHFALQRWWNSAIRAHLNSLTQTLSRGDFIGDCVVYEADSREVFVQFRWLFLVCVVAFSGCDDSGEAGAVSDASVMSDGSGGTAVEDMGMGGTPVLDGAPMPAGRLVVSSLALEFGRLAVGAEAEQRLSISNEGEGPLSVGLEGLAAPFTTSRMFPMTIPEGATRTIIFTFAPVAAGPVEQTINFVPDNGDGESVVLTGAAASPEGELLTDVLDFGVKAPGMAAAESVRIRNSSPNIPLNVIGTGVLEAPFSVPMGQLPTTLSPGEEAQILVQLNPEADGTFEQTLTINTNAGPFEVSVTARVVTPGDMSVTGMEPAWVVAGQETSVIIHGGPFPEGDVSVTVGETMLAEVERLDAWHLRGVVPATLMLSEDGPSALDVRVDAAGRFGLSPASVVVTPSLEQGRPLTLETLQAGPIGPEGNPWRLTVSEVPADVAVTITPGTVIIAEMDQRLRIFGPVQIGGEGPPVVFSSSNHEAGSWSGLNFDLDENNSTLQHVIVEYAGAGEAAVVVERPLGLTGFVVRRSASDALRIEDGAQLAFYSGEITDVNGDAIVMAPASSIFRFQRSRVRGAGWPMRADVGVFGRLPLGAGHDWQDNAQDAIGIHGSISNEVTLPNQPAGLSYRFYGDLRVLRGGALSFARGAPLVLDGVIELRGGALVLPPGFRISAEGNGAILADGGTFSAVGTVENPIVLGLASDMPVEPPAPWRGVNLAAVTQTEIAHLTIRGAGANGESALQLPAGPLEIAGLSVEESAGTALTIDGQITLTEAHFRDNPAGISIVGGNGLVQGTSTDAPAVTFADLALCDGWDVAGLLDGEQMPIETDCP